MVEYIINPSIISSHGRYKIRKSGLEKALKKGNWKAFLPESDKNKHDGNKFFDDKYGIFHFHLVPLDERKSKSNPSGKESDEIVIYIKPNNVIYIVAISNHEFFKGKGLKNILLTIEREQPYYLGNNLNYNFHIHQNAKSTSIFSVNPETALELLGFKSTYEPERILEFEAAVLYVLTENLKDFNINHAINLTNQITNDKLKYLEEVIERFVITANINRKFNKGSLIADYNISVLKAKFKDVVFINNFDLYSQIINTKITDTDYFNFHYEPFTKKEAPVLLKSRKHLFEHTDESLFALMQSPKTIFEV
jgi:hypothetical protein